MRKGLRCNDGDDDDNDNDTQDDDDDNDYDYGDDDDDDDDTVNNDSIKLVSNTQVLHRASFYHNTLHVRVRSSYGKFSDRNIRGYFDRSANVSRLVVKSFTQKYDNDKLD